MVSTRSKISLNGRRSKKDAMDNTIPSDLVSCSNRARLDQASSNGNGVGFFSLPLEIRHMVYRYYCQSTTDEIFQHNVDSYDLEQLVHSVTMVTCQEDEWEVAMSDAVLSKANRQVRAKLNATYSPMLYLRIQDSRPTIRHLDRWLLRHEAEIAWKRFNRLRIDFIRIAEEADLDLGDEDNLTMALCFRLDMRFPDSVQATYLKSRVYRVRMVLCSTAKSPRTIQLVTNPWRRLPWQTQ